MGEQMNSFYTVDELRDIGIKSIGKHVQISKKTSIYSPEKIRIGNHVRIDDFCILSGKIVLENYIHIAAYTSLFAGNEGIFMGDFSGVSSRVSIYSTSDDYSGEYLTNPTVPIKYKNIISGEVVLERHVIVGAGSVILPKVTLKEGSSVGAMSLVTKSTKEWTIYAGIPARVLKERKKELLKLEQKFIRETEGS
jgi:galactoside O-acetyltransferase